MYLRPTYIFPYTFTLTNTISYFPLQFYIYEQILNIK